MRQFTIALVLVFALSAPALAGPGVITGVVTAKGESGTERLIGVTVLLQGTVRGTTTNTKGEYRLADVPAGKHILVYSMVGYQRVTRSDIEVEEGKETTVNIVMVQAPVQTEQIIVTASKREQSLQEVPVSVSVLDAAEIRQRNSLTIDDALRYVPGVNITGFQVNIRGSSGYSRGAGSRVLMLLDGVPFITGDTGELNFESIPIGQVDHIEVVKGATSALYGSNALGGVINIITKPIPEIPETDVRSYAGYYNKPSFAQWNWSDKTRWFNGESVSHSRRVGDLGVSLFFSRQIDDGYRENDYLRRYNFYMKVKEDFSAATSLTLNFGLLYQYRGQFLYWRNLDSALVPPVLQVTDDVKSTRYYVSSLYNRVISDKFLFTAKAIWYHNDWGFETIHQYGINQSLSDDFRLEALSTLLLDGGHTLTFGVDGHLDAVSAKMLFGDRIGGGFALYGQDEIKLSDLWTLTLGARFDFESLGNMQPVGNLSPKVAVAYKPAEGTTVRASFGRGYRVPSVAEAFLSGDVSGLATVPNGNLRPEKSSSYEAGLSQKIGEWATFDIAGFRSDYDDLIEAGLIVSSTSLPIIQWRNVTKARVQGVETSIKLGLFEGGLMCNLGYTYVYPEDLSQHTILKYRPRHVFYANTSAKVGFLSAGADFRYISRMDNVDVELVNLGIVPDGDARVDILVTDFHLGFDLAFTGLPLTATVNVNNAFQRNYIELIGNMAPPRTYILVLEAKL